ncbi:YtrH family sporulation protein [Paenibacillus thermoaerophilus]|uniref:YtrH family sporulation protein n=1 Tax=Paenibacillus thermoaerophilus TaxID=1215385 RepID=A0ABW2UYX2_9BACL|nr:YtrH family sporulation protein [Paenibacillus thermoaerophilus]TMV16017.1 sporulation protein [Paenibacillus thermoaerophilus]
MAPLLSDLTKNFFVAFGMVLGASLLAGVWSILLFKPPAPYMLEIARNVKVWALVAAVGGTIDPIRIIEFNLAEGYLNSAFRQILYIVSAFVGAQMGTALIEWICEGGLRA